MAAALDVDWLDIRRTWENSTLGDVALAKRFGFASKTPIKRRRIAEGWTRDEAAIETLAAAGAVAAVKADEPSEPSEPPGGSKRAKSESQANRGSEGERAIGEPPKMGANTSLSRQLLPPAREPVDPVAVVQAEAVDASARQLRLARRLQAVSEKLLGAIEGVLDGPMLGGSCDPGEDMDEPNTPYGLAIITLRALNPDKDSLNTLLKAASEALLKGIDIERKALRMDAPIAGEESGASAPAGLLTAEQFVELHRDRLDVLEALDEVTAAITREGNRPRGTTIEGQSERVKE